MVIPLKVGGKKFGFFSYTSHFNHSLLFHMPILRVFPQTLCIYLLLTTFNLGVNEGE